MGRYGLPVACMLLFIGVPVHTQTSSPWKDPSPHIARFVTVDKNVQLEVLDWRGSGRPLILLAGGGDTAHVFDEFAPKLTAHYHVYGITRRGFGASGYSETNDPATRLGDDIVAVIDTLQLNRPFLVGHSIAGAELSSIANKHPDRIAGLIYLDAAYSYAFDNGNGSNVMDMDTLQRPEPPPPSAADLASFGALQKYYERINGFRFPEAELRQQREANPEGGVGKERNFPGAAMFMSLLRGTKKYTEIPAPALIIFANPHGQGRWVNDNTDPAVQAAARTYSRALESLTEKQKEAVENGVPSAHVIVLLGAHHYVFLSNESDVLSAIQSFVGELGRGLKAHTADARRGR
jgi:non-heme chloroperoxidase